MASRLQEMYALKRWKEEKDAVLAISQRKLEITTAEKNEESMLKQSVLIANTINMVNDMKTPSKIIVGSHLSLKSSPRPTGKNALHRSPKNLATKSQLPTTPHGKLLGGRKSKCTAPSNLPKPVENKNSHRTPINNKIALPGTPAKPVAHQVLKVATSPISPKQPTTPSRLPKYVKRHSYQRAA